MFLVISLLTASRLDDSHFSRDGNAQESEGCAMHNDSRPLKFNFTENDGEYGKENEDINFHPDKFNVTGKGVVVTVVGRGILSSHEQFNGTFDKTNEIHALNQDGVTRYEPTDSFNCFEGTSSASIGFGKSGLAPSVSLKYMYAPLANDYKIQYFTDAYRKIKSNIILLSAQHYTFLIKSGEISYPYVQLFQWTNATEETTINEPNVVTIISSGNAGIDPIDSQFHSLAYVWNTAVISSSTSIGSVAWYSQWSVCVLCNAPGGGSDTYTGGNFRENPQIASASSDGYNSYTSVNGTGASAAIVAGIVALMQEKSQNKLDFRQIMYRIATTAVVNDPKNPTWVRNAANYYYSPAFGFGRINADKALSIEELDIGPNVSSIHYPMSGNDEDVQYLPYGNEDAAQIRIPAEDAAATIVEQVQICFATRKIIFTDLSIRLISPSGTLSIMRRGGIGFGFKTYEKTPKQPLESYIVTSRAFMGEKARGIWTLKIRHSGYNPLDEMWGISLKIFGTNKTTGVKSNQTISLNDPFNCTNEEKIVFDSENLECNKTINYHFNASVFRNTFMNETYESFILPTYLKMNSTNRIFDLDQITIKKESVLNGEIVNYTMMAPCLLNQTVAIRFGIRHPINGISIESNAFHLKNSCKDKHITNYPVYYAFDNPGVNSRILFHYSRQSMELPEHGFNQRIEIIIFDLHKRNIYYTHHSVDNGQFEIVFNTTSINQDVTEIRKGVLSITPMLDLQAEFCRTTYFPFRIYSGRETDKPTYKFKIPINNSGSCLLDSDLLHVDRRYLQELEEYDPDECLLYGIGVPFIITGLTILFGILAYLFSMQKSVQPNNSEVVLTL